jgi:hypothetical protein
LCVENNFFVRFSGGRLSIDGLNEHAEEWIQNISAKPVSGMNETRQKRFEDEKKYLHKTACGVYDVRTVVDLIVSRESCITYETNRYSVPPQYIGRTVSCRPGIFERTLSIYSGTDLIKTIMLDDAGGRKKIINTEDKIALLKIWEEQRRRQIRWRTPEKKTHIPVQIEVAVRSPAFYEQFLSGDKHGNI